jgi:hypothetical protein
MAELIYIMIILEFIISVFSIPLASLYLSTILITDLLFIVSLSSCYISEIHGGLFQLTLFSQIPLIFLGGSSLIEESNILLSLIPIVVYSNAGIDKSIILKDNKGKAGVYQWTHLESGKIYIGSATDLSVRLKGYFNKNYLSRVKSNSYIYLVYLY